MLKNTGRNPKRLPLGLAVAFVLTALWGVSICGAVVLAQIGHPGPLQAYKQIGDLYGPVLALLLALLGIAQFMIDQNRKGRH